MAVCNNLFSGVEIDKDKVCISHLQYTDDTIFFGMDHHEVSFVAKCYDCKIGSVPFNYLGLPIGANMNKMSSWMPVINKFEKHLSDWKARLVSFGGRVTLVKSVLNSLRLYFFSLYRAPPCVKIDDMGVPFSKSFVKVVGNGSSTSFWHDVWVDGMKLWDKYKRLFKLESNSNATVTDSWVWNGSSWCGNWDWVRIPRGRTVADLVMLVSDLNSCTLAPDKQDSWRWQGANNGVFTTK
ncbi:uncharacterized protein [Rutidosis leptorrhynchoides]|uniref:uncharacterized protein n=1 Tax=Rutidosis leptorrhynchoides TaxID=125765 RepID=UPI003A9929B6